MAGRIVATFFILSAVLASAALASLLYFSPGDQADAVTYDIEAGFRLSCDADGDGDTSCVAGTERAVGITSDSITEFDVPAFAGSNHSNFASTITTHAPSAFWVATDAQLPNGSWVATISAQVTLSVLNAACPTAFTNFVVQIPIFDCSTDNSGHNVIPWIGDGSNMTLDTDGNGLPQGCDQYPDFLNDQFNGVKPRARYFGYGFPLADSSASQLNFAIFGPDQLSQVPGAPADMGDSMGYMSFVFLNNPNVPDTPNSVTEFCAPLSTDILNFGKTQGEGEAIPISTAGSGLPETSVQCLVAGDQDGDGVADDGCFIVTDKCLVAGDDDGDGLTNELCDLNRHKNPSTAGGLNGTHLAYGYSQGNRDADGDTIPNSEDECPLQVNTLLDPDADGVDNVCDPADNTADTDMDDDGFRNLQDSCVFVDDREAACGADTVDNDNDNYINDGCPAVGPAEDALTECNNDLDDDGDGGNINDGCTVIASLDQDIAAPGPAPDYGTLGDGIGAACETGNIEALGAAETACNDNVDDDADTKADDGCALSGTFPNGPYIKVMPVGAICIGVAATDDDGDGWCDITEGNLGSASATVPEGGTEFGNLPINPLVSAAAKCGNGIDDDGDTFIDGADAGCKTPESSTIDYAVDPAPQTCSDFNYYEYPSTALGVPVGLDNDGDTLLNGADAGCNAAWPTGCAGDADCDGVVDATDNCTNDANPTQLNSDGSTTEALTLRGDACDLDDDNDNAAGGPFDNSDVGEWSAGTDPKDPCNARGHRFDLNSNGTINVADVVAYSNVLNKTCLAPLPAYPYSKP
jgi:hypothetical protein